MKNKQCFKSPVPSHKNLRWDRFPASFVNRRVIFLPILVSSLREKLSTKCQAELGNLL